jgi:D-arabinose 5-phosphate isomerase GutQ
MVTSKIAPILEPKGVTYRVHVLAHSTNTAGIAEAIAEKAKEIGAHSITMTHHKKSNITVRAEFAVCIRVLSTCGVLRRR